MTSRARALLSCVIAMPALAACAQADRATATAQATPPPAARAHGGDMRVTTIASGLEHPWSVAVLPGGGFLVTERPGRLRRIAPDGAVSPPVTGLPEVFAEGQGGLLDVVLAPDYGQTRRIYFSYAEPGPRGTAGTAVAHAVLDGDALSDVTRIYAQAPRLDGGQHFGARIAFDGAGHVFISQGDRNRKEMAQDLAVMQGKLVRLRLDGSIPPDNPFAGRDDARPETWSYGHRNIQGMAVDPRTGTLWTSEHGPRGGDELNLPEAGANYGWPLATHGVDYITRRPYPQTIGTSAPGTEPPHHWWKESPGLSGMAFLTGRPGSAWNDSLFLGALAEESLIRLSLDGNRIVGEERLLEDLGARIRDVRVGPEGALYVLTDAADGTLLRLDAPTPE